MMTWLGRRFLRQIPAHRSPDPSRIGRVVAVALGLASLGLVPWMVYLGFTLPHRYEASHWSVLWIGFDVIECVVLASIAWLAWRRRRTMAAMALVAGTLLFSDAWFDVITSWGTQSSRFTLLTAIVVELPLAAFLYWLAYRAIQRARMSAPASLGESFPNSTPIGRGSTPLSAHRVGPGLASEVSTDQLIAEVQALSTELHDALVDLSRVVAEGDVDRRTRVQVQDAVERVFEGIHALPADADPDPEQLAETSSQVRGRTREVPSATTSLSA